MVCVVRARAFGGRLRPVTAAGLELPPPHSECGGGCALWPEAPSEKEIGRCVSARKVL